MTYWGYNITMFNHMQIKPYYRKGEQSKFYVGPI